MYTFHIYAASGVKVGMVDGSAAAKKAAQAVKGYAQLASGYIYWDFRSE